MDNEEWVVEEFYFGSANWPSDSRWRRKGTQLQSGVEHRVRSYLGNAGTPEVMAEIEEFKNKFRDVVIKVYPPSETTPATMFLLGWLDRTGEKTAWQRYREDKQYSM